MRFVGVFPFETSQIVILGCILALLLAASGCNFPLAASAAPSATPAGASQKLLDTAAPTIPPPSPSVPPANPQALEGWQVYRSQQYAFQLKYPPGGELVEERPDGARINLPFEPGTNLQDKYLQIDVQVEPARCQSPLASGYSPAALEQADVQVGGHVFLRQSGSEGAAGNFYDWVAYSTTREDTCISLTFVLHSLNPYNFETPLAEFDRQEESRSFEEIAATFEWLP